MGDGTAIAWTDATWNVVTGCDEVTAGCDNCYARRFAERWRGSAGHYFEHGFDVTLRPERMGVPLTWRRPRRIFVNSLSDLFHKAVPRAYVDRVFDVMEDAARHDFQVLTKRSSVMRDYLRARYADRAPPANVWAGVSVEDASGAARLAHLRDAPAAVRFVSAEPLLGHLGTLDLSGVDQVIVGGESGPGFRPCDPGAVREVRDACLDAGVAFFFKQWGGARPTSGGRTLDGREWDEFPRPHPSARAA